MKNIVKTAFLFLYTYLKNYLYKNIQIKTIDIFPIGGIKTYDAHDRFFMDLSKALDRIEPWAEFYGDIDKECFSYYIVNHCDSHLQIFCPRSYIQEIVTKYSSKYNIEIGSFYKGCGDSYQKNMYSFKLQNKRQCGFIEL